MSKILAVSVISILLYVAIPRQALAAIEFTIANPATDGDMTSIDVAISGLTTSSCLDGKCYLQAAYTKQGSARYFGYTKNNDDEWYKYDGSPGKENIKSNFFSFEPQNGLWQGALTLKVDPDDSDYKGSGIYDIKVWRYSGNSDSNSGSSDTILSVDLTLEAQLEEPTQPQTQTDTENSITPSSTAKTSPTPKTSSKNIMSPTPKVQSAKTKSTPAPDKTELENENTSDSFSPNTSLFSPSPIPAQKASKNVAGFLVASGIVLMSLSAFGYLYFNRRVANSINPDEKKGTHD